MSAQDPGQEAVAPLDQAAVERLDTLLNETADMNVALGRLLDGDNLGDCPLALVELRKAMDRRLAMAMNLLATGDEEG